MKCLLDGCSVTESIGKGMLASLESINSVDSAIPIFTADVLTKILGRKDEG